jgi:hypothetical protein
VEADPTVVADITKHGERVFPSRHLDGEAIKAIQVCVAGDRRFKSVWRGALCMSLRRFKRFRCFNMLH